MREPVNYVLIEMVYPTESFLYRVWYCISR